MRHDCEGQSAMYEAALRLRDCCAVMTSALDSLAGTVLVHGTDAVHVRSARIHKLARQLLCHAMVMDQALWQTGHQCPCVKLRTQNSPAITAVLSLPALCSTASDTLYKHCGHAASGLRPATGIVLL